MAAKRLPIGICDQCGQPFPSGVTLYTRRGPRLHCSRECRNAANSQAGAALRSEQQRSKVAAGRWINPMHVLSPEALAAKNRRAATLGRKREVAEDRWRNPALAVGARQKLSQPRRHGDDLDLHAAIEKLGAGASVASLTEAERQAHRAYRRKLRAARAEEDRAYHRAYYRRRKFDE